MIRFLMLAALLALTGCYVVPVEPGPVYYAPAPYYVPPVGLNFWYSDHGGGHGGGHHDGWRH